MAASPGSNFQAMVLLATFDKLETVIEGQTDDLLGSFIGAAVRGPADAWYGLKTGLKFSEIWPIAKAQYVSADTLFVHGEEATMIPPSRRKALFNSLPQDIEKEWLLIPNAGHSDVLVTDYPLYAKMAEWLLSHFTP